MPRNCPTCGGAVPETTNRCPNCRQAVRQTEVQHSLAPLPHTTGRRDKKDVELNLPRFLPDARYCFGKTWTSGALYLLPEGIFFLSEKDGYTTPESCKDLKPLQGVAKVGTLGFWASEKDIEKVYRVILVNAAVTITGRKVPLRLDSEGWDVLAAYCALAGIPVE